ncbi:glyoxalase/bleomycin resistance protein/dioxygenase [Flavobacterium limnosediminis JC2902]|uniref:Glyoxalase/bleomycin resistance protein/dioxygenase n=1 Tax=Flavobacterium limnosediminis JC2902 TaxID=1341181 RepID=V6SPP5_9FLAO|nr:VOC family protein [Flavobacterium limnosediminis]ESU28172.1 glyoxalase/bleomycin resistance protein/dioxygenase [Flavobacterium limnosediminis JC2902]
MKLRIARHTDDLEKIKTFYIDVLGFELLGGFENHDNYDGIFIGKPDSDWHFEFTQSDTKANHFSDEDDITVLYPETISEYNNLINKIINSNISTITSANPYWNTNGKMILDPDGFRIIISDLKAK